MGCAGEMGGGLGLERAYVFDLWLLKWLSGLRWRKGGWFMIRVAFFGLSTGCSQG